MPVGGGVGCEVVEGVVRESLVEGGCGHMVFACGVGAVCDELA